MAFHADFASTLTKLPTGTVISSHTRQGKEDNITELPILLLLHGFPQNHTMWRQFVDYIPDRFTIVAIDLPGYGNSTKRPSVDSSSRNHSKKEWAKDVMTFIDEHFSGRKVIPFGHDRGGRLAYRIALDFPDRVAGLGVLDIVPTPHAWAAMDYDHNMHQETFYSAHWVSNLVNSYNIR